MSPKETILFGLREATQTPVISIQEGSELLNPNLPPPPELMYNRILDFLPQLIGQPDIFLELPTPVSAPTISLKSRELIAQAGSLGVADQIAFHIRGLRLDAQSALDIGATRLHIYQSVKHRNSPQMLSALREVASLTEQSQYQGRSYSFRASIEHATSLTEETEESFLTGFVQGLRSINRELPGSPYKAIGIPDTTGTGRPEQYLRFFAILSKLNAHEFTFFTHFHNDSGMAMENLEAFREACRRYGFDFCTEVAPDNYRGERYGIRPMEQDLGLNLPEFFQGAPSLVPVFNNSIIHVAGVHTKNQDRYTPNGTKSFPHSGVYTIMGVRNVTFLQELLNKTTTEETARAAAVVGRETAAQLGHQSQLIMLALINLAYSHPEFILQQNRIIEGSKDSSPNISDVVDALQNQIG